MIFFGHFVRNRMDNVEAKANSETLMKLELLHLSNIQVHIIPFNRLKWDRRSNSYFHYKAIYAFCMHNSQIKGMYVCILEEYAEE